MINSKIKYIAEKYLILPLENFRVRSLCKAIDYFEITNIVHYFIDFGIKGHC